MWQNSLFRRVLNQKNPSKSATREKEYNGLIRFVWGYTLICMVPWPSVPEFILLSIVLMLREYNSKYVKALQFYEVRILHACSIKKIYRNVSMLKKNAWLKSSMAIFNSKNRLPVISFSLSAFSESSMVPFKCHHPVLFLTKLGCLDMLVLNI